MNSIEKGQLNKLFIEIERVRKRLTPTQEFFLQSILFLQSRFMPKNDRSVKYMIELDKLNKAEGKIACNECRKKECCLTEPDSNEYCIFFDTKKMKCSVYANRPLHCRLWVCDKFSKEDISDICKELNIMPDMVMLNTDTKEVTKIT